MHLDADCVRLYPREVNYFDAIILSIVEGITEFLPISSTGHLILTTKLLGIAETDFVKTFEVVIQLGAIMAIVLLYKDKLLQGPKVWKNIIIAFIPTGIIGLTVYDFVKNVLLGNAMITVISLLIGGVIILLIEKFYQEEDHSQMELEDLPIRKAIVLGVIQTLAVVPGVSRSGATIFGGMFMGFNRKTAADFSFLLAIPTMAAASGYDLLKTSGEFSQHQYILLAIGLLGSFVVAYVVVKQLLKYIQNHTFMVFGWYRIVAAILFYLIVLR